MFKYYIAGDYAIDIDVTGCDCGNITIADVTFSGNCGVMAGLKIAQRGGAGDDSNGIATIGGVDLSGLTFNNTGAKSDILLGNEPNYVSEEEPAELRDYNSAFPVRLDAQATTSLGIWGGDINGSNNFELELTPGSQASITPASQIGNAGEGTGSVSITLERGSATASGKLGTNMSLTAGSGTSIAFVDFQNTGGNTIRIESGADYSGDAGDNVYVEPTQTPGYDDDEGLPPFVPTQPAEDDNTVTIVACAAAAAVAAILAVFLVIDRKP